MEEKKKFKLHMPHVLTLIFFLIIVVAILTWILPSGEFERKVMETSAGERSVAVAGTYHSVDKVLEDGTNLRQGIAQVLMAPGKGIQQMVEVLAFVFIIGGVFQIMAKTNALNMGIQKIVKKLGAKEILIIPILMVLFGLGGSTFGMSDELIPFYLLIMPIMFAMGYDSMTTFMTVCLSAMADNWFNLHYIPLLLKEMDCLCHLIAGFRMKDADTTEAMKRNTRPVLFFHGEKDTYVYPNNSFQNYMLCRAPKELVIVPGARHLCSAYAEPELYQRTVMEFFEKYDGSNSEK